MTSGLPGGTTTPDIGAVSDVIGEPPPRRPSDPRSTAQARSGGSGRPGQGRPGRARRPTGPWKARPPANGNGNGNGSNGNGSNGSRANGAEPRGAGDQAGQRPAHKKKRPAQGGWDKRATPAAPGRPARPAKPAKPGRPGKPAAASSGRRRHSANGHVAGGAPAGGSHGKRRRGPVGAKRSQGGSGRGR